MQPLSMSLPLSVTCWKYPNLTIDQNGNLWHSDNNQMIKSFTSNGCYKAYSLIFEGSTKLEYCHKLVAMSFDQYRIGAVPRDPTIKYEIDHIDRDKSNNNINNLRICTRSENMLNRKKWKQSQTAISNRKTITAFKKYLAKE